MGSVNDLPHDANFPSAATSDPSDAPDLAAAPATSAAPSAYDGNGTHGNNGSDSLSSKIDRASTEAVDEHLSENPRRGSGKKRGPYKRRKATPRPRVPLEAMDRGPVLPLFPTDAPTPLEPVLPDAPTFDAESAGALVEVACGLLNDSASAVVRAIAKKETGDDILATEAAAAVRMSEKIESAVRKGALECARKYSVKLEYAPEMMLFGGLIVWSGQIAMSIRELKAKGTELRMNSNGEVRAA